MTLSDSPLPADTTGLLEGLTTTRAIRMYTDDPVPDDVLRAVLFAASESWGRAPAWAVDPPGTAFTTTLPS